MNMAVNPLVAQLGGGAMPQSGMMTTQMGGAQFATLINPAMPAAAQLEGNVSLLAKAQTVVSNLTEIDGLNDIDLSGLSLGDLMAALSGDADLLEDLDLGGTELSDLMAALSDVQDLLRDVLDALPGLMQILGPFDEAQNGLGVPELAEILGELEAEPELLSFAAIYEVAVVLQEAVQRQPVAQGALTHLRTDALKIQITQKTTREIQFLTQPEARPIHALSLMSELPVDMAAEAAVLAEIGGNPSKEALSISPMGAMMFRAMVTVAVQTQKQNVPGLDFETNEAQLSLTSRSEPSLFEQLDQTKAPQQAQRPENQISTKFANVLVNQVRAVDVQEGTTRIELSPRGLGSIEIEMRTNNDGSLAVVVRAENDAVLASLREERDLLAAIIGENESGSLDFQEFSQEQNNGQSDIGGSDETTGGGEAEQSELAAVSGPVLNGSELDLVT